VRKALFLDRDGVVNVEKNYVYRIEDFEFIDGIFSLVQAAQKRGYLPVIITNQAGIGRGYYTEEDFHVLTQWMVGEFAMRSITIAGVYYCPYHETAGVGKYRKASFDRKPKPGMLFRARDELQIDLSKSVLIGDKASDMEAGRNAGVETQVLYSEHAINHEVAFDLPGMVAFASLSDITMALFH